MFLGARALQVSVVEHRVDALLRLHARIFVEFYAVCLFRMAQCLEDVLEGVRLHVLAHAAAPDEFHVGVLVVHACIEPAFRKEQDLALGRKTIDVLDHLTGTAHKIAVECRRRVALGVAHHLEARVLTAEELDEFGIVRLVHVAAAVVEHDVLLDAAAFHLVLDVLAHELVGHKANLVVRVGFHNLHHVAARDAHVAGGLHVGRGVDVADEGVFRVLLAERLHVLAGNGVGEAAAREFARDEHVLFGAQDLGRLAHEADCGEQDSLLWDLRGVFAQLVAVARVVGNAEHDFRCTVAVREDDSILVFFALVDLVDQREHLFDFFAGVVAEHRTRLDLVQSVEKFVRGHSGVKYRKCRSMGRVGDAPLFGENTFQPRKNVESALIQPQKNVIPLVWSFLADCSKKI